VTNRLRARATWLGGAALLVAATACSSTSHGSGTGGTPDAGDAGDARDASSAGFVDTANSITVKMAAGRSDPERVAPPSPSISELTWMDSRNAARTLYLYGYLYQYDFTFVGGIKGDPTAVTTRSAGDDAQGHAGFGYVVSHNTLNSNSTLGKADAPTLVETEVFSGGHHAIHHIELVYARDGAAGDKESGGMGIQIPVVIEWMVATGRDHPVWSVTWKMGSVVNPENVNFNTNTNDYAMDSRGPYGSLNFDGASTAAAGDTIGGVSWGDFALSFTSTTAPLTMNSSWTYNTPNTVDYSRAWTTTVNSEMGIVETKPGDKSMGYQDLVVGRQRGSTSSTYTGNCTGLGDPREYTMPCVDGWAYQLMEYDWENGGDKPVGQDTTTKLVAWGSPYGWLGASSYSNFDYSASNLNGTGDRSYATFIVLGPRCRYQGAACTGDGDVALTVQSVDALAQATLSDFTAGAVATSAPAGPGATQTKALVNGYNDTYAAYYLVPASGNVAFQFTPAAGEPVDRPIFVLSGVTPTKLPVITVGGSPRTVNTGAADSGAFVSYRSDTSELWITINQTLGAAVSIAIAP
jgi:hypothetical protein